MDLSFDACLSSFEVVVERSRQARDRVGLFATMYAGVTREVRRRCDDGTFADPDRMEHFVALFAHRYFDAHATWRAGNPPPKSWLVAFEAAARWRPVVLQHLVLGMNAHINLDLGIVAADLAGGPAGLPGLRPDFEAVNDVLGSIVEDSQGALDSVSPWLGLADHLGAGNDEAVVRFSLRRARARAWELAVRLASLPQEERPAEIERVDAAAAGLGQRILHPGTPVSAGLLLVRLREPWRATSALDAMERAGST